MRGIAESEVLPEPLRARIGELSEKQLIALRFASDAEVAGLVERTLQERLEAKQIKQAIPQATLAVLPKVRHITPVECPAVIAEKILEVLRRA